MKKNNKKEQVYHSMEEIEKKFFPNSRKRRLLETEEDPHIFGADLAMESLNKIKHLLQTS